ncbi:hypothetical protein CLOHYLEM_05419 [[Clostridium] hylemonae DSM 15053]|uniref:Uncharacterized protein n=1 Tax=[Clostridium] hylemonae DSM 15053 TaxID=553973 RepID=C0C028_9FIRM|nr:hypothetical protein CLOHYLEM_05419 [[Clostridium] hylemonae DSM 15053]
MYFYDNTGPRPIARICRGPAKALYDFFCVRQIYLKQIFNM